MNCSARQLFVISSVLILVLMMFRSNPESLTIGYYFTTERVRDQALSTRPNLSNNTNSSFQLSFDDVSSSVSTSSLNSTSNHSKFAYFTLVGGMDPYDPGLLENGRGYLGYLLHLVVVKYIHDITGNTADLGILFKMINASHVLPKPQEKFLSEKLGYRIISIPPSPRRQKFGTLMMEKFRILNFTEYDRVLFFDADVMMICQTDYLFRLSMNGTLAPNLVLSWNLEPAQGGFFMLEPREGDYRRISRMRFMNENMGFGSPLEEMAVGIRQNYTAWNWHGVKVDQGLLYHWVRYIKQNVSIVTRRGVTRWRGKTMDDNNIIQRQDQDFDSFPYSCPNHFPVNTDIPIYRDHVHFTGGSKPWKNFNWENPSQKVQRSMGATAFWGIKLHQAWKEYNLPPVKTLFPEVSPSSLQGIDLNRIDNFLSKPLLA